MASELHAAMTDQRDEETYTAVTRSSTATDADLDKYIDDDVDPDRARKVEQAVEEGHDADIPSNIGYVLNTIGELKRQKSIVSQRSAALSRKKSHASNHDPEKEGDVVTNDQKPTEIEDNDPNIVFWDGEDDPANPYNWPNWLTTVNCCIISLVTFITPLASSIFAPGIPELMRDFKSDSAELASFVVSVYVLGFAFGPMLVAPLSEIYGRLPVYHVCNVGFFVFLVACAVAPSLNTLIVFRFFSGIFGSCPITNGGGSIADMVRQEHRAAVMSVFSMGPLMGPIIGPVAGGFLTAAKGWRWVFWVLVIASGVTSVVMFIFMRETYAPVILQQKVARLRKETGNTLLRSKLDVGLSPRDYFKRGIVRPYKLLTRSPICAIFALYMTVIYGYLYLMFTTLTEVFQGTYGFSTQLAGLSFLGMGIGSIIGLAIFSATSDKYLKKMSEKEGRGFLPEYRLQMLPLGAIMMPVGFFIYGWTAQYHVHWIVPIIGTTVIGTGNLILFMAIQM